MKKNLTGTVIYESRVEKGEIFHINLSMPKVLKNNWTKLYSEVNVCRCLLRPDVPNT